MYMPYSIMALILSKSMDAATKQTWLPGIDTFTRWLPQCQILAKFWWKIATVQTQSSNPIEIYLRHLDVPIITTERVMIYETITEVS